MADHSGSSLIPIRCIDNLALWQALMQAGKASASARAWHRAAQSAARCPVHVHGWADWQRLHGAAALPDAQVKAALAGVLSGGPELAELSSHPDQAPADHVAAFCGSSSISELSISQHTQGLQSTSHGQVDAAGDLDASVSGEQLDSASLPDLYAAVEFHTETTIAVSSALAVPPSGRAPATRKRRRAGAGPPPEPASPQPCAERPASVLSVATAPAEPDAVGALPGLQRATSLPLPPRAPCTAHAAVASASLQKQLTLTSSMALSQAAPKSRATAAAAGQGLSDAAVARNLLVSSATWEVVLVLDSREVLSRAQRHYMRAQLATAGVRLEVRALPLGDVLWLARPRAAACHGSASGAAASVSSAISQQALEDMADAEYNQAMNLGAHDNTSAPVNTQRTLASALKRTGSEHSPQQEWVLNWIVERKQASDLCASIRDGRYEEQKRRLVDCPCANVVYLVEGSPTRADVLNPAAVRSAMASTQISAGFRVVHTASVDASVSYLAQLHRTIARTFMPPAGRTVPLSACLLHPSTGPVSFASFSSSCKKTVGATINSVWGAALRQVRGCSASRAAAILKAYPTPAALTAAYAKLGAFNSMAVDRLLAHLPVSGAGRVTRVGPKVSTAVAAVFAPQRVEPEPFSGPEV